MTLRLTHNYFNTIFKIIEFECQICGIKKPTQLTMIKHLKSKHNKDQEFFTY